MGKKVRFINSIQNLTFRFATEESNKNELSENEAKILAKLNARLKKRELEQVSNNSYIQHEEIETNTNDDEKPKKKKRKKEKKTKTETEDVSVTEDNQTEVADDQKEGITSEPAENVESNEALEEQTAEEPIEEEQIGAGFTVLEEIKSKKLGKIHRVLPNWLAKPSVISCDLSTNILPVKDMKGLDRFITDALKKNKIKNFFPGFYQFKLPKSFFYLYNF